MAWSRIFLLATGYALALFLIQAHWLAPLGYFGFRLDLLLPLSLHVALELPLSFALAWVFMWGFIQDTFTGRLWGLHLCSYLLAFVLVHLASERIELQNIGYRLVCVAVCAALQSLVLGIYLVIHLAAPLYDVTVWFPLLLRIVLITVVTPLVGFPFTRYVDRFKGV